MLACVFADESLFVGFVPVAVFFLPNYDFVNRKFGTPEGIMAYALNALGRSHIAN
jgi:hypothetical protein